MAGIYIHIPFCKQACFYCDFHFSTSLKKKSELIDALILELELRKAELQNDTIDTIYFGGGTPSLLTMSEISRIIEGVYKNYSVSENPEISLEANPDDLSETTIKSLAESPVNRLSIGIQSFFETDLKQMNRAHNAKEARACLDMATSYFNNITIDLIYGIPKMSLDQWNENLQIAFGYNIQHISSYALTIEPKTALESFIKKGDYPPIDDTLALQHFNHLISETERNGFVQYEISNFGIPGYFSKHNTSYWKGKSYLGIGPSAHSFNTTTRSWNIANNSKYIDSIQKRLLPNTAETLSINDQYNEYVMTGLRTIWGVSLEELTHRFGLIYVEHFLKFSHKFLNQGTLERKDASVTVTNKGKFLVDGIAAELFMI